MDADQEMREKRSASPGKKISDKRMLNIQKIVEIKVNVNFRDLPKRDLKSFLGNIGREDITNIAKFGIINQFSLKKLKSILTCINSLQGNTVNVEVIEEDLVQEMDRMNGEVQKYNREYKDWLGERQERGRIDTTPLPLPPKEIVAFNLNALEYTYIEDRAAREETLKGTIANINREIQLSKYNLYPKRNRDIYIPLRFLRQLKAIDIMIMNLGKPNTVITLEVIGLEDKDEVDSHYFSEVEDVITFKIECLIESNRTWKSDRGTLNKIFLPRKLLDRRNQLKVKIDNMIDVLQTITIFLDKDKKIRVKKQQ